MPLIALVKICMQILKQNLTGFLLFIKKTRHTHTQTCFFISLSALETSEMEQLTEMLINFKTLRL